nr:hypothetical protein [Kibdelosporangium sp. MJ126-NF4]
MRLDNPNPIVMNLDTHAKERGAAPNKAQQPLVLINRQRVHRPKPTRSSSDRQALHNIR